CNSKVKKESGEVNYYCSNQNCSAIKEQEISHFVSKKAFNIEGFGIKIVEQLLKEKLIKNIADIFKLKKKSLLFLERFAEKSVDNLLEAIDNSKKIELDRFIYALGIRHVGDETSILLAKKFGSIKNIMEAKQEDLEMIHDIGIKVAESITNYFQNQDKQKIIKKLLENGVNPSLVKLKKQKLAQQTFVLTGSLENYTRDQVQKIIRDLGGKISSSISKNTNYLLSGKQPGSKYEKAQKLGVKIINEVEFEKML
ncbi:NAD-dependent DNA ligase LigA, partial [bacterium]|nr:NAD-dependent DNA ligase LigA [bacterium]